MTNPAELEAKLAPDASRSADVAVLALAEEQLTVSKRAVAGQTVRIATTTQSHEQLVEEQLAREDVVIERVAIGRVVDATPEVRQEGDVTILPVMEEVLVLERRLVLKEEVRITRVRTSELHREPVQLRRQAATVTPPAPGQAAAPATPPPHPP